MAELKKFEDLPYEYQQTAEEPTLEVSETPKVEQVLDSARLSPLRRLRHVSLVERFFIVAIVIAIISGAVLMIKTRNTVSKTENEITAMQNQIAKKEDKSKQLTQEKAELSRSERVKKIAEEKGLSVNDGNLRKVK